MHIILTLLLLLIPAQAEEVPSHQNFLRKLKEQRRPLKALAIFNEWMQYARIHRPTEFRLDPIFKSSSVHFTFRMAIFDSKDPIASAKLHAEWKSFAHTYHPFQHFLAPEDTSEHIHKQFKESLEEESNIDRLLCLYSAWCSFYKSSPALCNNTLNPLMHRNKIHRRFQRALQEAKECEDIIHCYMEWVKFWEENHTSARHIKPPQAYQSLYESARLEKDRYAAHFARQHNAANKKVSYQVQRMIKRYPDAHFCIDSLDEFQKSFEEFYLQSSSDDTWAGNMTRLSLDARWVENLTESQWEE